jgi:hypothetical protein
MKKKKVTVDQLNVSEFTELIKRQLRKFNGTWFAKRTDITTNNGYWYIDFLKKDIKQFPVLEQWTLVGLRRADVLKLFTELQQQKPTGEN